MKNILIPTKPDDQHAHFVKLALEVKGHRATLWYTADFPELQTHTFEVNQENDIHWQSSGLNFNVKKADKFDTVWWRRPRRPVLPDYVHPEDVENANNENLEMYKTFWHIIAPDAYWINPTWAAKESSCKLLQLKVAKGLGFNTPKTMISNDPNDIKNFILNNGTIQTIYKPLFPSAWFGKDDVHLTYTKEITLNMLPGDKYLQTTAGIFQEKIEKAFELRVNMLGNTCIAVKLLSQEHPDGKHDWRQIPTNQIRIEKFKLPEDMLKKCKLFMRKLGIVFGCFDFIVTPKGEYYFLEINEQGQFLWIEDVNPEIKMLDAFTDFLIAGSDTFDWSESADSIVMKDYTLKMLQEKEHAMKAHKVPDTLF